MLADDGCLVGERTRGIGLLGWTGFVFLISILLPQFQFFIFIFPDSAVCPFVAARRWARGAWMGSCFFFRGALAECSAASDRRAISVIFSSARLALCSRRLRRVLPVGGCASGHGWDGGEREGRAEWVNGTVLAGCWICGFEWSWVDDILDAVWMGEDGRVE